MCESIKKKRFKKKKLFCFDKIRPLYPTLLCTHQTKFTNKKCNLKRIELNGCQLHLNDCGGLLQIGIENQVKYVYKLRNEISKTILDTLKNAIPELTNLIVEFVGINGISFLSLKNNDWPYLGPSLSLISIFFLLFFLILVLILVFFEC